jgi:hypothetical protein
MIKLLERAVLYATRSALSYPGWQLSRRDGQQATQSGGDHRQQQTANTGSTLTARGCISPEVAQLRIDRSMRSNQPEIPGH